MRSVPAVAALAVLLVHAAVAAPVVRKPAASHPAPAPVAPAPIESAAPPPPGPSVDTAPGGVSLVPPRAIARVLATTSSTVRFAVTAPDPALEPTTGDAQHVRLALAGFGIESRPGEPELPVRTLRVAVPPQGPVGVSAVGLAPETRENVALAPPTAPAAEPKRMSAVLAPRVEVTPGALRPARAELRSVGWLRNQRIAEIAVYPADYDRSTRRLTLWRTVEVTVSMHPTAPVTQRAESADPFEPVYRAALLNYAQGLQWRRPARAAGVSGLEGVADSVPSTSIIAGRKWAKLAITHAGVYAVSFAQLRQLNAFKNDDGTVRFDIRADDLRMFTWSTSADPRAVGSPMMPEKNYCDSCGYRQVAIQTVTEANDPIFNHPSDYVYFYALGPNGWANEYDPANPDTIHDDHPYETREYYYLGIADASGDLGTPLRIGFGDGAVGQGGAVPATWPERRHYEEDHDYSPHATPLETSGDSLLRVSTQRWEKWYWKKLLNIGHTGDRFATTVLATGIDFQQPIRLRTVVWGLNWPQVPLGYVEMIPSHLVRLQVDQRNGPAFSTGWRGFDGPYPELFDHSFLVGDSVLTFRVLQPDTLDPGNPYRLDTDGVTWFDLYYQRSFVPQGDTLVFTAPGTGLHEYHIGPFSSGPATQSARVFDVTWPNAPVEITGFSVDTTGRAIAFTSNDDIVRRYRVWMQPLALEASQILDVPAAANLRLSSNTADYLVIYYDGFKAAADSLIAWRSEHMPPGAHGASTFAVPVSRIYDQFGGGHEDPAAIRGLARAVYFNWNGGSPRTAWVTLLGDASYDHKNILGNAQPGQPGCLLPTYENNYDPFFLVRSQYVTDDWMFDVVRTGGEIAVLPDFYVGRIPVDDPASALDVVRNKVLLAERANALGTWRNRIMFVADDNIVPSGDEGFYHVQQTAQLDQFRTPLQIDRAYVYLHKYPTEAGGSKPGARADIQKFVNAGVLIFNYVGHGSPYQLADERVFLDSDVGSLLNAPRFGLFLSASCDVGKFIDPAVQSLGERLLTSTRGGSVAVISATELALSNQNAQLNGDIYQALFDPAHVGGVNFPDTLRVLIPVADGQIAPALLVGKVLSPSTNSTKYELLGDAAAQLPLPEHAVELSVTDTSGAPIDSLPHGALLEVHGRVLDQPGGQLLPLQGQVDVLIEDSKPFEQAPGSYVVYPYYAGTIYHGAMTVRDGTFSGRFFVPLEARFGDAARLRAYVSGLPAGGAVDEDGVGAIPSRVVAGAPAAGDITGPLITLSFPGGATIVRPGAVLRVDLHDPSGILTTGHAAQNGIIVTVDGSSINRYDITSSFQYNPDSYQTGTAHFTLPDLSPGQHSITVSAADNLAAGLAAGVHRSTASITFDVQDTPPLKIVRTYLFPSPTRSGGAGSGGEFVVDVAGDSVNVLVRVYTASGRLVRTLRNFGGFGQVQIPWDGLDDEGDALANGVYFYRVHLNPRDVDGTSSARQKAETDGRFVILNR